MNRAAGYAVITVRTIRANAAEDRFGVTPVKCRPPWFDDAKHVGRPAAAVLVTAFGDVPGARGPRWPHIGVQRHRLLVEADNRFRGAVRAFIHREHIFHAREVGRVDVSDAPHFSPATE